MKRVALAWTHCRESITSSWKAAVEHRELSRGLCGDLEGWVAGGGREAQEEAEYVYV